MPDQLELKPFQAAPDDVNVRWLENLLDGAKCWMTAKDIALTTNGKALDRDIRVLASASKWILSGPGSPGYKHIKHSTPEEVNHFADATKSQGVNMLKRSIRMRKAAHEIFG